jgi:DNA modification methylase
MHTETTLSDKHPAPYPVQLPFNCIRFYTFEQEIVVDPFGGAGTTMIAAHQLNRKARLIEIDPRYVQASIDRFKQLYPNEAVKINGN